MITDIDLRLDPEASSSRDVLLRESARKLGLSPTAVNDLRIVRRSIDARRKRVVVQLTVRVAWGDDLSVVKASDACEYKDVSASPYKLVIVGAGPAGLFAALRALELGIKPIVLERGRDVDSRRLDIAKLNRSGEVDADSNYCFGEGGAGTFSDGKLFTRSKKRGDVSAILRLLHEHGADESILVDAHPHIGSDRLPGVIKNIRQTIIAHGGEVHFNSRVSRLILSPDGKSVVGAETEAGDRYEGSVILATGHSARDVYRMLKEQGVYMEAKGLAIGVRLEHPQSLVDQIQYHSPEGRGRWLPAAEYSFVCQAAERGVYSFCMCPGGVVVPAVSAPGELVVNGMSASARASRHANSGMVVELHPGDFPEFSGAGELEMLSLQESLEKRFFEASGHTLNAPAQRMADFVEGRLSKTLPSTSYLPGIHSARVDELLPPPISNRLKEGFKNFGRKAHGFLTNDAVVIGLESRTSAPVRIPRDRETMMHRDIAGLYPVGEGAGYAGGIVSAAIDGRNATDAFFRNEAALTAPQP